MLNLGFKQFLMASPLIIPIMLFCSVLLVTFFFERVFYYTVYGKFPKDKWEKLLALVQGARIQDAIALCHNTSALFAEVFQAGLEKAHMSRADVEDAMFAKKEEVQEKLRQRLGLFGTLAFISPLLGLLGTVMGIYTAFHDLALSGQGGPAIIAAGVSEALVATAVGIVVAVPAAVAYNYFTFRLRGLIVNMNSYSQQLVIAIFGRGK